MDSPIIYARPEINAMNKFVHQQLRNMTKVSSPVVRIGDAENAARVVLVVSKDAAGAVATLDHAWVEASIEAAGAGTSCGKGICALDTLVTFSALLPLLQEEPGAKDDGNKCHNTDDHTSDDAARVRVSSGAGLGVCRWGLSRLFLSLSDCLVDCFGLTTNSDDRWSCDNFRGS